MQIEFNQNQNKTDFISERIKLTSKGVRMKRLLNLPSFSITSLIVANESVVRLEFVNFVSYFLSFQIMRTILTIQSCYFEWFGELSFMFCLCALALDCRKCQMLSALFVLLTLYFKRRAHIKHLFANRHRNQQQFTDGKTTFATKDFRHFSILCFFPMKLFN